MVRLPPRTLGNVHYPFIFITSRSTLTRSNEKYLFVSNLWVKQKFTYLEDMEPFNCVQTKD